MDRIEHSTHVRTLIFTEEEISSVVANIDGETVLMQRTGTNLWTAPWEPKSGAQGTVRIDVNTSTGNASSVHQYKTNYDSIKSSTVSLQPVFIPMHSKIFGNFDNIIRIAIKISQENVVTLPVGFEKNQFHMDHVTWPIFSNPDSF